MVEAATGASSRWTRSRPSHDADAGGTSRRASAGPLSHLGPLLLAVRRPSPIARPPTSPWPPARQYGRQHQILRVVPPKQVRHARPARFWRVLGLTGHSLGGALTDTLDMLITEHRIQPQLAMKILLNFDKAVADVLSDKVKSRLTFKVSLVLKQCRLAPARLMCDCRDISTPTASATTCGLLSSKTSTLSLTIPTKSTPTGSRL